MIEREEKKGIELIEWCKLNEGIKRCDFRGR
jgi:hypothetical protein